MLNLMSYSTRYSRRVSGITLAREGELEQQKDLRKSHKSPFVIVLSITLSSLDVNISVVHTTSSDKGQEQHLVCGFPTFHLRSTAESNGEAVKAW